MRSAVLDVEIVCLHEDGKPEFRDLLFRRGEPRFVTFDLLWSEGQDLRYSPLTERKHKVQTILSTGSDRILLLRSHRARWLGPAPALPATTTREPTLFMESLHLKPLDGCSVVSNSRMGHARA